MTDRFDQILDECIDRITLKGETVEGCVARYPEYAAELRRYLPLIARADHAYAFTPDRSVKDLGRQKLQTRLHVLRQKDALKKSRRPPWRSLVSGWRPRWAIALASLMLAVVISGAGTVAASRGAIPGDLLYPVKVSAEEVRLALEFSEADKAQLNLVYAERRTDEMTALLKKGDTFRLESSQKRLRKHLTEASRIADKMEDAREIAVLKSDMEMSSSRALANLQAALQTIPRAGEQTGADVFQSSGEAYSESLEALAAKSGRRPAEATGTLQFRAISPPFEGVAEVRLEVEKIEAHMAAGSESRWIAISQGPETFDLVRIANVQKFLEERKVQAGSYTRVRLQLGSVTVVTSDGLEFKAKISGGPISLARPFRVEEGKTTVVFLSFEGTRLQRPPGHDEYTLTPRVAALVSEPGREQVPAATPSQKEPAGREAVQVKVDLEGTIESLGAGFLVVKDKRIAINNNTRLEGVLEPGQKVQVEAVVQPDGSFVAARIKVQKPEKEQQREDGKEGKEPARTPRDGKTQEPASTPRLTPGPTPTPKATPRPEPTSTPAATLPPVRLEGSVELIEGLQWRVAGRTVQLEAETKIDGRVVVGSSVLIEGRQSNGAVIATRISLSPPGQGPDGKPGPGQRPGRTPESKPGQGAVPTPPATPTPGPVSLPTAVPSPGPVLPSIPVPTKTP